MVRSYGLGLPIIEQLLSKNQCSLWKSLETQNTQEQADLSQNNGLHVEEEGNLELKCSWIDLSF